MSKLIDLTGIKFNRLTVIELKGYDKRGESLWNCICECGNVAIITTQSLISGTRSCGKCIDTRYKIQGEITIGIIATGEEFIIDTIDLLKVQNYNWYISSAGYVVRKLKDSRNKSVWMHREIINALDGTIVDHINRDKKDNRLSNLRTCNQQQNMTNVGLINTNTTGYKGVSQTKNGRYRAYTDYKNKRYHLGTMDTKEEAALFRDKIVEKLNGEFAWLNFKEI